MFDNANIQTINDISGFQPIPGIVDIIRETPKAILVEIRYESGCTSENWIPKSQVRVWVNPPFHNTLAVKDWFAFQNLRGAL